MIKNFVKTIEMAYHHLKSKVIINENYFIVTVLDAWLKQKNIIYFKF
jgi:zona occludens toxin (predicted ATPase)